MVMVESEHKDRIKQRVEDEFKPDAAGDQSMGEHRMDMARKVK